ncbi:MAG: NUDIX hydrolase [Candidatus Parvarchaeota archaeon]|nr:NUDIX hydrolase [Candidatus Jingweiarchaeum tengchongense]
MKNKEKLEPRKMVDAIIPYRNGIVLIERAVEPFKGKLALPGGHIEKGESAEEAVKREVKEETGLEVKIKRLVGIYSGPHRDPRYPTISSCYICDVIGGNLKASSDAKKVVILNRVNAHDLAFDHSKMIKDANLIEVIE